MKQFRKKQTNLNVKYHKAMFLILLTISSLPILKGTVSNYILIILTLTSIIILLLTSDIYFNHYITWSLLVGLYLILSVFWSLDTTLAIGQSKKYFLTMIIYSYLALLIKDKSDLISAFKIFILSRLVMLIYIIITIDISTLGTMRIGASSLGEEWNSNAIGMNFALAALSIIVVLKNGDRKLKKPLYLLLFILFSTFTLLTGSRKALFILIFSIFTYILLISRKKILKNGIIYGALLFILYFFIMKTEFLYEILGKRIEGLIASLTGTGEVDNSTSTRKFMIDMGIEFFKERPILGYGINNYRELLGIFAGDYRYSHNNYIELLVGIGLFGTVLYYFAFYYLIKKSLNNINNLTIFTIVTSLVILIIDYGLVSYNSLYIHFLICVSFSALAISSREEYKNKLD